jgi:hypothetical protein
MVNEFNFAWLREPVTKDDTWARTDEGLLEWLTRSTLPRAREARRFLNFNLSKLPTSWGECLCGALETRWQSAFFELVVARTLQAVGATVEVEVATASGTKPDFLAWFGEQGFVVEATSPEFLTEFEHNRRHVDPLNAIIEQATPAGWSVFVEELPDIGPSDSKREFKRVVTRLLALPPPDSDSATRHIDEEFCDGMIRLTVLAKGAGHAPVAGGPAFGYYSNAVFKIRRAVKRKRKQVRSSGHPRFLAIDARFGATFSDFDRALFGDGSGLDGEFIGKRKGEPVCAGVMAFPEVGFTCPHEPVLYIHPRFSSRLPTELDAFERKVMNSDGQIVRLPASKRVLEALCPVDPSL